MLTIGTCNKTSNTVVPSRNSTKQINYLRHTPSSPSSCASEKIDSSASWSVLLELSDREVDKSPQMAPLAAIMRTPSLFTEIIFFPTPPKLSLKIVFLLSTSRNTNLHFLRIGDYSETKNQKTKRRKAKQTTKRQQKISLSLASGTFLVHENSCEMRNNRAFAWGAPAISSDN